MQDLIMGCAIAFWIFLIAGLVNPQSLSKIFKQKWTRFHIVLIWFFGFWGCLILAAHTSPEQDSNVRESNSQPKENQASLQSTPTIDTKQPNLSHDAQKILDVVQEIQTIENGFDKHQTTFKDTLSFIAKGKKLKKQEQEASKLALDNMLEILEQSQKVQYPSLSNTEAQRYINDAIDTHKKWAFTTKVKFYAFFNAKFDEAEHLTKQADSYAEQEAISLIMAQKAIGLIKQ